MNFWKLATTCICQIQYFPLGMFDFWPKIYLHDFASLTWKLDNPYYHNQGLDYGRLLENLKADGNDLDTYLTGFRWDESRYPINQSLKNLTDIISKKVGQIEAGNKVESQAYNSHRTNLQILEKKQAGSLITRDLGYLAKGEHFR